METVFIQGTVILLLLVSISRWVYSMLNTRDFAGLSAIVARLYFMLAFLTYSSKGIVLREDTPSFLLILGVGALLLDEDFYWLSFMAEKILHNYKKRALIKKEKNNG
jgi:hypothetical protein